MRRDKIRYFHEEVDTQVTEYEVLSPDAPCEVLKQIPVGFNIVGDKLIGKWISEALVAQIIPTGTWTFYLWCRKTGGEGNIYAKVYHWSAGVETLLCTSTKGAIPDVYSEVVVTADFPKTEFAEGDKIVVELRFEIITERKGKKGYFACDTSDYNSRVETTEPIGIPYTVEVTDTAITTDYVKKSPSKALVDILVVTDWYSKDAMKSILEITKTLDWYAKDTLRNFFDIGKSVDWYSKTPLKSFLETVTTLDWYAKDVLRSFIDSVIIADYLAKDIVRSFIDVGKVADILKKTKALYREFTDVSKSIDWYGKDILRNFFDLGKAIDYLAKDTLKSFIDIGKLVDYLARRQFVRTFFDTVTVLDWIWKLKFRPYTWAYRKTYEEWVAEKAVRIQSILRLYFLKRLPIDIQKLTSRLYWERLFGLGKWSWKPLDRRFLDYKPSAFIRNFIYYLIAELQDRGYMDENLFVLSIPSLDVLKEICKWTDPAYRKKRRKACD